MKPAALRLDGLVKRFGGLLATDQVSLQVPAGELHALIGPNGAGKTTLIGQIAGALRPDAGHVFLGDRDVTPLSLHRRVQAGLARSYQITSVFRSYTVLDNLLLAVQAHSGSSFRFWRPRAAETALRDEAVAVAGRVGLDNRLDVPAAELSHGEQRQLEVGLTLALRPAVLLLDEPMAGMGPQESETLVELLASLRGEVTMLLVEHDMDAVFRLADRISVLVYGRVLVTGRPDEIRHHPEVIKAYLGEDHAHQPATAREAA